VNETTELPHEFLARIARGGVVDGHRVSRTTQKECAAAVRAYSEPIFNPREAAGMKQALEQHMAGKAVRFVRHRTNK
jgi:hypothetical protein